MEVEKKRETSTTILDDASESGVGQQPAPRSLFAVDQLAVQRSTSAEQVIDHWQEHRFEWTRERISSK